MALPLQSVKQELGCSILCFDDPNNVAFFRKHKSSFIACWFSQPYEQWWDSPIVTTGSHRAPSGGQKRDRFWASGTSGRLVFRPPQAPKAFLHGYAIREGLRGPTLLFCYSSIFFKKI